MFVSVWTMIVTSYLLVAPLKFPGLAPVIAILALDALTMLFWFAAFIALAVWKSNLLFSCNAGICGRIIAGIVFGAFEWLVFFSLFFSLPFLRIQDKYTLHLCNGKGRKFFPSHHNLNDFANHIFLQPIGFSLSSLPLFLLSLSVVVVRPQILHRPQQRSK